MCHMSYKIVIKKNWVIEEKRQKWKTEKTHPEVINYFELTVEHASRRISTFVLTELINSDERC